APAPLLRPPPDEDEVRALSGATPEAPLPPVGGEGGWGVAGGFDQNTKYRPSPTKVWPAGYRLAASAGRTALPPNPPGAPRGGAEGVEGAVQVDGQDPAPLRSRHLPERSGVPAPAHARVGEAGVDPAEAGNRLGEGGLDGRLVGDVDPQGKDGVAVTQEPGARRVVLDVARAPDRHAGPGRGQGVGHPEADPAVPAGDERHLAREIEESGGHTPHGTISERPRRDPSLTGARSASMREAVVVQSSRTPLAKSFRGSFNLTRPDELAAHV